MAGKAGGNHSTSHSALVAACVQYLRLQHAWVLKVLGGLGQRAGCPDLLVCLQGRLIAVECKTGTAVLTRNQQREREALERAGAIYIEARDLEDVEDAVVAAGLGRPLLVVRERQRR